MSRRASHVVCIGGLIDDDAIAARFYLEGGGVDDLLGAEIFGFYLATSTPIVVECADVRDAARLRSLARQGWPEPADGAAP